MIQSSETHIGWFNWGSLVKAVVFAKHPLTRTRLLLIRVGKLKIELYNYFCRHTLFQVHHPEPKSKCYGVIILNVKLSILLF